MINEILAEFEKQMSRVVEVNSDKTITVLGVPKETKDWLSQALSKLGAEEYERGRNDEKLKRIEWLCEKIEQLSTSSNQEN